VLTALTEYFLLRRADAAVEGTSPDAHRRARARLLLGRQKAASADTLWRNDHRAEALALLRAALDEAVAAARILARDGVDWASSLKAAGGSGPDIDAAAEAHRAAHEEAIPALDADVAPRFEARRAELVEGFDALDRALAPTIVSRDELAALRRVRVGFLAVAVVTAGVLGARAGLREKRAAVASAYLLSPPGFPPANAVDGDANTEWILPLGFPGWIDVHFERPRALRAVRLLNAHNRTHNDLASRDYRVEVFAGGRMVGGAQGAFSGINPAGSWARHPIAARGVTRVRVWVDTFHGAAGGLGEIEFE
jgi:hypothetical protein